MHTFVLHTYIFDIKSSDFQSISKVTRSYIGISPQRNISWLNKFNNEIGNLKTQQSFSF